MSDRRNDATQPRALPSTHDTNGDGPSQAPAQRQLHEDNGTEQVNTSSESLARSLRMPRNGMRSLQRLLETAQRGSRDLTPSLGLSNENGSFIERTEATIQAIENRARGLERRHREFQTELDVEQNRVRRRERAAAVEIHTSSTRLPGHTLTADNASRPPQIPSDTAWPRTMDRGASGIESTPATMRTNNEFPQMRSVEWLRENYAHANQEYERYRNDFLERRERLLNGRTENDTPGSNRPSNSGVTADSDPATTTEPLNASSVVERSASARRDLERALRDYRIARRALRNHYNNEPASPSDQTHTAPQSAMAQIADQRDRYRTRARGNSRLNSLEHSDMIVNGIAAAAGVNTDAWHSDDDDTSADLATRFMELQRRMVGEGREPLPLVHPPHLSSARGVTTRLPYLGPTTTGQTSISSGGMRDHYQRLQERRGSGRINDPQRSVAPGPESSIETSTGSATRQRRRPETDRYQRLNETIDRFSDTLFRLQDRTPTLPTNLYKSKAKKALKYLSLLHGLNNDSDRSADWAKELGFHSLIESLAKEIEIDLPLRIDELPNPQFSSWLENGMSWTGYQKGGYSKPDNWYSSTMGGLASGPLFESSGPSEDRIFQLRGWRHRERMRAERLERERSDRSAGDTWQNNGLLNGLTNGIETLADVERHLSNLLEEEERRLTRDGGEAWNSPGTNTSIGIGTQAAISDKEQHDDRWPVRVTLHEVNWQDMKVFGTMVASHVSGRLTPTASAPDSVPMTTETMHESCKNHGTEATKMETFFDGEIIDFRIHQLETVIGKPGYRVGGIENDVKHWSRIGPFREVINTNIQRLMDTKAKDASSGLGVTTQPTKQKDEHLGTDIQDTSGYLDEADIDSVVDETMADCLGSRKWLETALGEGGWILMRWKGMSSALQPSAILSVGSMWPSLFETSIANLSV